MLKDRDRIILEVLESFSETSLLSSFGRSRIPKETILDKILYFFRIKKRKPTPEDIGRTITFRRAHKFSAKAMGKPKEI